MLASTGSALIRAASPKLAQLAGSAVASYHAIYDVGNSTNIKWWVLVVRDLQGSLLPLLLLSSTGSELVAAFPSLRHEGGVTAEQKEDLLGQKGCVLW